MPPDTPPGLYPIRAQLIVTGDDAESMPASWRQVVEDVATVSVGTPGEDNEIVYLVGEPVDVEVAAGEILPARRDGRHGGGRKPVAGGAPDQPVGNLGVDRSRRCRAPC